MKNLLLTATLLAASILPAQAAMLLTEVDPNGSSATTGYGADWFELTNTGTVAVDITGWKMDDNSNSFALSVALRGVTSIAPKQSVIFLEGLADGSTDAAIQANFKTAWFGTAVPPALTLANYGGPGVGLSSTTDAVNIFDATGTLIANVSFGASAVGATFDNTAGVNNATLVTFSQAGVNGAFTSASGLEVGSPAVPEPGTYVLFGAGLLLGGMQRFRRTRA